MRWWEENRTVYLAVGAVDMRKAVNGLSLLVQSEDIGDLFSGDLFVFCNRNHGIIKVLYWDNNGFSLWQKRLEKHHFKWPKTRQEVLKIKSEQLHWLLTGLDIGQAHQELKYTGVN